MKRKLKSFLPFCWPFCRVFFDEIARFVFFVPLKKGLSNYCCRPAFRIPELLFGFPDTQKSFELEKIVDSMLYVRASTVSSFFAENNSFGARFIVICVLNHITHSGAWVMYHITQNHFLQIFGRPPDYQITVRQCLN